jgi:hypothetical protein
MTLTLLAIGISTFSGYLLGNLVAYCYYHYWRR